jgi:addiction module HigA family antidote
MLSRLSRPVGIGTADMSQRRFCDNYAATELARQLDMPTNRITQILNGTRAITGDTALRLAHFFGTGAEF